MFRTVAWVLLSIVLLIGAGAAPAQTVEWWDRAGEAYTSFRHRPAIYQVTATQHGVYSVGAADCRDGVAYRACKGLLSKYDADGSRTWRLLTQVGDVATINHGVAVDDSGIYVVGTAVLDDPRFDSGPHAYWETAFVQKYTHDGVEAWRYVDWFDGPPGYRIKNSTGCSIVVDDSGIYTTTGHRLRKRCGGFLRKLSFDGELLWLGGYGTALAAGDGKVFTESGAYSANGEFLGSRIRQAANIPPHGLAYHDGALYFCSTDRFRGWAQGPAQVEVYKTDLEGNVAWSVTYPPSIRLAGPTYGSESRQTCAIEAKADRVYLASNLAFRPFDTRYRPGLTLRQWDLAGMPVATWDFPSLAESTPYSLAVLGAAVFLSGGDVSAGIGFTARASGSALLAPVSVPLDDNEELAVIDHHYGAGAVVAAVRRIDGTGDGRAVGFSDDLRPIDVFAVADLNGNGAPELGVLSREPPVVEVVDSRTGRALSSIALDSDFEPLAAVTTEANAPILAVLMQHRAREYLRVEEFNARSGDSLRSISFNPAFHALDLLALGAGPDRRYAVLQANPEPGKAGKLEIRDTRDSAALNAWLGKNMEPVQALVYAENGGAERIAVLRRNVAAGWQDIAIVDADAATIVQTLSFNPQYVGTEFVHSADVDANLAPQFSVAGRRDSDGKFKVETRDLATGAVLHNVFLTPDQPVQDLVYLGPGSGAATPSLGLLVRVHDGFAVTLVDLLTGAETGQLEFEP